METLKTILKTIFLSFILPVLVLTLLMIISEDVAIYITFTSPLIVFTLSYLSFRYFSHKENEKNNQGKI